MWLLLLPFALASTHILLILCLKCLSTLKRLLNSYLLKYLKIKLPKIADKTPYVYFTLWSKTELNVRVQEFPNSREDPQKFVCLFLKNLE